MHPNKNVYLDGPNFLVTTMTSLQAKNSLKSKSLSPEKKTAATTAKNTEEWKSHQSGTTARVTFADVQESMMSTLETVLSSEDEDSKRSLPEHDDINSMDGCSFSYRRPIGAWGLEHSFHPDC